MKSQKTPLALAACALFAVAPFAAEAAPNMSFRKPDGGSTVTQTIQGSACEVTGTNIRRVVFSLVSSTGTTTALNTDTASPWNCTLNPSNFPNGSYTLRAVAYDSLTGGASDTDTRSIKIQNSGGSTNTPPSVSITSPGNGSTVSGTSTNVSCGATALDNNGVSRVVFSLDGAVIANDTASPYTCSFDATKLAPGSHTLKAEATDSLGATNSTQISFNVGSGGGTNTPPSVSITSPGNGATVSGPTVGCGATASDSNGVARVVFTLDGAPLVTDTTSPYTCSFDATKLAPGSHTLRAQATDSLGASNATQISFNVGSAAAAPTVSFKAPQNGAAITTALSHSNGGCEALATPSSSTNPVKQVQFYLGSTLLGTEGLAPWTCNLNPATQKPGSYIMKAVATDSSGQKGEAQINVTIGSGGGGTNTPPSVSFTAPNNGDTLSGKTAAYAANASDTGGSVAKVDFFLVKGSTQTPIGTKTAAPYQGTLDTTAQQNGSYTLMAQATDNLGLVATTQRNVSISNVSPDPDPSPGSGTTLPSTNASAVATFESLGMYWKPGSNPGAAGCSLRYRKFTESAWREGLAMWYDSRNSECRGSIVHLEPGTDYAVEMGVGTQFTAGVNTKTWAESFPIGQTVQVQNSSQTLRITQGGTSTAYVLYTGPATIDVADGQDFNVEISAPYVIVRGLTLKGARRDGIRLLPGARDVVIEGNDISGWGRQGVDRDSAVNADCAGAGSKFLERAVVQRNKLHHPRYGSNSWDTGHPAGPQAITFNTCGGNHVLRYNEVYSSDGGNYFNDAFSGGSNYSDIGFPNADTDIYGNKISHTWDDAIEAEGGNRNVRIWGNYMDQTATGIASTVTHHGPLYVFRNVYNRNRQRKVSLDDSTSRSGYFKAGAANGYGNGRRYMFHNTALQAVQSGVSNPLGIGIGLSGNTGQPLTNTVSRNNIFHVWRSSAVSIGQQSGSFGNDANYDLFNGALSSFSGAQANGMVGTPTYEDGHGWSNWGGGNYQLKPGTKGHDNGARLPNFNDGYTGNGPDVGAHEHGTPAMKFGVSAAGGTWIAPTSGTTTSTSTSTTGSTTTTTSSSGGGVCSTITCAAQ